MLFHHLGGIFDTEFVNITGNVRSGTIADDGREPVLLDACSTDELLAVEVRLSEQLFVDDHTIDSDELLLQFLTEGLFTLCLSAPAIGLILLSQHHLTINHQFVNGTDQGLIFFYCFLYIIKLYDCPNQQEDDNQRHYCQPELLSADFTLFGMGFVDGGQFLGIDIGITTFE